MSTAAPRQKRHLSRSEQRARRRSIDVRAAQAAGGGAGGPPLPCPDGEEAVSRSQDHTDEQDPALPRPDYRQQARLQRALQQRLFLLDRNCHDPLRQLFVILGTTGMVHRCVVTFPQAHCSCPDYGAHHHWCKHLLFVICRVLRADPSSFDWTGPARVSATFVHSLRPPDLAADGDLPVAASDILRQYAASQGATLARTHPVPIAPEQVRRPIEGACDPGPWGERGMSVPSLCVGVRWRCVRVRLAGDCPICFEPLAFMAEAASERLVWCRFGCGNNMHEVRAFTVCHCPQRVGVFVC